MAIFNPGNQDLTGDYGNIIAALNERARIEGKNTGNYGLANAVVEPIAQHIEKQATLAQNEDIQKRKEQREFEMKLKSEGRQLFTQDMADELVKDAPDHILPEDVQPFIGTYQKPEELHKYIAQKQLARTYPSPSKSAAALVNPEAAAKAEFETDVFGKLFPVADKNSPTGYTYYTLNKAGQTISTNQPAPPPSSGSGSQPKPLPTAERSQFVQLNEIGNNIQKIVDDFSPENIGPVAGRKAEAEQYIEGLSSKKQTSFIQATTALRNTIIKGRSGGAVTPSEAERLIAELPDTKMSVGSFKSKLQNVMDQYNSMLELRTKSVKDANYIGVPDIKPVRGLQENIRIKVAGPNGQTGTVAKGTKLPSGWKIVEE